MEKVDRARYPTNLTKINTNATFPKDTKKYFNNYFDIPVTVSSNIDSAITAFFERLTDNKDSARALASSVIYTSLKQGIDPMATLDEFKKLAPGELDVYTALFLNFERKGTSYLGIVNEPEVDKYIQRSIRF
jgi:hypothetical protein